MYIFFLFLFSFSFGNNEDFISFLGKEFSGQKESFLLAIKELNSGYKKFSKYKIEDFGPKNEN
jgi:hypothetical protein